MLNTRQMLSWDLTPEHAPGKESIMSKAGSRQDTLSQS